MTPPRAFLASAIGVAAVIGSLTPAGATEDVGDVVFPNSGAPAAQAAFLHGVAQLHNFEYEEAAADFQNAEKIDPEFAMAYWGEAMTYNHTIWQHQDAKAARQALSRLGATLPERLAKAPTEREKDYLRAVDALYYGSEDANARDFVYAAAMKSLYEKYGGDVEAGAFYALALMGTAHAGRDIPTYLKAADILEPLFQAHPKHPGLAHYMIHALDDPEHAARALPAAQAYSVIATKSSHAQHMCSHIFVALGMWAETARANELATALDARAAVANGERPSHCGHYNEFLEYGYLEEGAQEKAKDLLAACRADASADESSLDSFGGMRDRYLIDSEDWDGDVAHWAAPSALDGTSRFSWEFADGVAAARRGDQGGARAAYAKLTALSGPFRTSALARIDLLQLRALVLEGQGESSQAVELLKRAAAIEDGLPIAFGPPTDKPSYELLGETLLHARRFGEARQAFEKALAMTPRRQQAVRGLALTQTASAPASAPSSALAPAPMKPGPILQSLQEFSGFER